jgi:hypothetical protein
VQEVEAQRGERRLVEATDHPQIAHRTATWSTATRRTFTWSIKTSDPSRLPSKDKHQDREDAQSETQDASRPQYARDPCAISGQ